MKALTVAQPFASLIVHGVKQWETRPSPPNGDMRPGGVRGLPGLRIDRGERIAIHAAGKWTDVDGWQYLRDDRKADLDRLDALSCAGIDPDYFNSGDDGRGNWVAYLPEELHEAAPPFGAVIGTVEVGGCHPIVRDNSDLWLIRGGIFQPCSQTLSQDMGEDHVILDDQLPLGDWATGRWAWQLNDPVVFDEPISATGKQGVWEWQQ